MLGLSISIIPDIYRLTITPQGTFFPLIHNHTGDYFYYLSLIRQGIEGNILLTSRMTPEHFSPALAQTFFAVLGWIAKILGIDNIAIYFLSRIITGFLLLIAIIFLAQKVFKSGKFIILASFLAIFATGFWLPTTDKAKALGVLQYLTHWTKLDPIIRTTYLPHHLISTFLGIVSIILLSSALKAKSWQKGIAAGILAALGGFVYFATFINFLGALVILIFIIVLRRISETLFGKSLNLSVILGIPTLHRETPESIGDSGRTSGRTAWYIPSFARMTLISRSFSIFLIYILFASISLIYLFMLSKSGFPWSVYDRVGENFTLYLPFMHYIYSLGPTFILTLIGLPIIFSNFTFLNGFLLSWALFPFTGLFILSKIFDRYGNVYFLESSNYIPLGILAVYGLERLYQVFSKKKIYAALGITLLVIYFIPPLSSSIIAESARLSPFYYNLFIPNDIKDGMNWLDKFTPKESVVLSGGFFGNIIPAFAHNRVVYGHPANTFQPDKKMKDTDIFFAQNDLREAKNILSKYHVNYVFYSKDTDPPNENFTSSLGFNLIYQNPQVVIFKTTAD